MIIHGGYISGYVTTGRSIETEHVPKGTPKWGAKWKKAFVENYLTTMSIALMGAVMPNRDNCLDLDPTYRDVHGRPLMRMTFDFKHNELAMRLSRAMCGVPGGTGRAWCRWTTCRTCGRR